MKLLQRYVLREFLLPFAYCFGTFYGLYVLSTLLDRFRKLADAHPPFWFAVRYFLDYMSPYVVWLLPAALMFAALYTMWRFCRHGEIVAMRTSGLSYATIVLPMVAAAALVSVLCALNQEFYAPQGREFARRAEAHGFRPFANDIRESVTYYHYAARRVWLVNRIDLDHPDTIEGVRISVERPDGKKSVDISCRRASYLDGVWWLFDPQYRYFDDTGNPLPAAPEPLHRLTLRPMPQFDERPADFVHEKKEWDYLPVSSMLSYLRAHPALPADERASRMYDVHARLSMPWSCIVVTLFAIPAGVASGRQSAFKGILLAIALFFGFYVVTNACLLLAKQGMIAPWLGAWLPNFAFLGAGGVLFARLK